MRANTKPSVKVGNLSCRFSNSLVTGIDQQPCELPEHKSPSSFQEEVKKIWFIVEENPLRWVQESCDKECAVLPLTSLIHLGCFLFTHLRVTCSAWSFLGEAENKRTEHASTKRTHRPVRDQYYWCSLCQTECVKCMTSWAKIKAKVVIIPSLRASFLSSDGQCSHHTHLD